MHLSQFGPSVSSMWMSISKQRPILMNRRRNLFQIKRLKQPPELWYESSINRWLESICYISLGQRRHQGQCRWTRVVDHNAQLLSTYFLHASDTDQSRSSCLVKKRCYKSISHHKPYDDSAWSFCPVQKQKPRWHELDSCPSMSPVKVAAEGQQTRGKYSNRRSADVRMDMYSQEVNSNVKVF